MQSIKRILKNPQVVVFLVGVVVLIARRPDAVTSAQFWAEDGMVWFAQAYNHDYSILIFAKAYSGYIHAIPRLTAELSYFVPLPKAPLFFNSVALMFQVLPLVYLWSKRFTRTISSTSMKVAMTMVYLLLPFTEEIHVNLTNTQWFLALLGFLLIQLDAPKTIFQKVTDITLLALIGLTGPFAIFLLPFAFVNYYRHKDQTAKLRLVIIGLCAAVQVAVLLLSERSGNAVIGISFHQLIVIVGGQVFGAGLFGQQELSKFITEAWVNPLFAVMGTGFMTYIFVKGPYVLKLFIAYSMLIFAAALALPLHIGPDVTWWQSLSIVGGYGRYFFMLHLALYFSLCYVVLSKKEFHAILRYACASILALSLLTGVRSDFIHPAYKDYGYKQAILKFEGNSKIQSANIPINPESWYFKLNK